MLDLVVLCRAGQNHRHLARVQLVEQPSCAGQRGDLLANGVEPSRVLILCLLRDAGGARLAEELGEQSRALHADQPVRAGGGYVDTVRAKRACPGNGVQVGGVDQRAVDVDQDRVISHASGMPVPLARQTHARSMRRRSSPFSTANASQSLLKYTSICARCDQRRIRSAHCSSSRGE